ncbi:anti-sigma factor family protein [Streptomyces sp. NPDC001312]|uniref:anti-sigma factor family protein n=1 Tax=Streptomyces sp. NPDC001312 TaxID=3364561 RepID=UPI0036CC4BF3
MTSTTDTAGHPDVTEISDLTEGLLDPSRAEDLQRHLDECELCADVHASLTEIRDLLGTLPDVPAMPADVADRIDAALAAEAPVTGPPVTGGARVSRETSAVDRPSRHPRASSTGPGRKTGTRRGRRRVAVLGSVVALAALGVTTVVLTSLHDDKRSDTAAHDRPSASADTFSAGTLKSEVADLLAQEQRPRRDTHTPHDFGVESAAGTDKPKLLKSQPPTVPSCVRQGINDSGTPLAARAGTYDGKEAYLVVLPDASGESTRVTAYLVDATCVRHPDVTAKVLLSHSYARS